MNFIKGTYTCEFCKSTVDFFIGCNCKLALKAKNGDIPPILDIASEVKSLFYDDSKRFPNYWAVVDSILINDSIRIPYSAKDINFGGMAEFITKTTCNDQSISTNNFDLIELRFDLKTFFLSDILKDHLKIKLKKVEEEKKTND